MRRRDVKDSEGVIVRIPEETGGALRKGLTENSFVERLESRERRAREPAWDGDAHRDWQAQAAVTAEGNLVIAALQELELWKTSDPDRAAPIKTAPWAGLVQAGRKAGDEHPDLSLPHSFSLLQCLPLPETQLKNQKAGNRI